MERKTFLALALALSAVTSNGAAADALDVSPTLVLANWVGTWKLDRARSEPNEKLLVALDVPWAVRKVSAVFTPSFDVTNRDGVIEVAVSTPIGSRVDRFHGDGVERDGADLLGRKFVESTRWAADGDLILKRIIQLNDGTANMEVVWSVLGSDLVSITAVKVGSDEPVTVRRVFGKVSGDGS